MKDEKEYLLEKSRQTIQRREDQLREAKKRAFDTVALWGLYDQEEMRRFKSMTLPIFMSNTGGPYDSLLDASLALSYQTVDDPNKIYTRVDNNTTDHLAMKFAALEGLHVRNFTQGFCTSSGMSAIFMATQAFLGVGDNFVSSNRVYGGTQQLFSVTYPRSGWKVRWVENPENIDAWERLIDGNTQFLYVESPSNPGLFIADLFKLSKLAHSHGIPLIVDSTIASPALTQPLAHGADIVIHSASKIANGSCRAIGGVLVSLDKITTNVFDLKENFATKIKGGDFRNLGPCMSPQNAQIIWDEMSTLRMRMEKHSENAMIIAEFLERHSKIEKVNYPGLPSHPQHELAKKTMRLPGGKNAYGFLMSFNIKGGMEKAKKFAEVFDFGVQVTHLGGNYTIWTHCATTTHGQMSQKERDAAGIPDNLIRYSVGLEGAYDAILSLDKALEQI